MMYLCRLLLAVIVYEIEGVIHDDDDDDDFHMVG